MRTSVLFACLLLSDTLAALAQGRGWPRPPEPAELSQPVAKNTTPQPKLPMDSVQLERDARELSDLANSLPADIDHVNHGLLPKNTIEKLKRIEKLSKRLRGEISP